MKYFTIAELCRSQVASAMHIDNSPTPEVKAHLTALVENILDPLREAWGRPIRVNSGYRSPQLNKAVGGVPTSQHLTGEAADITTGSDVDNRKLYQLAQSLGLPFDQLIGNKYDFKWLHISYCPTRTRKQIF
ncbi:MAG: D-Ala-D-Ala carboxypeptidase family metallohydrolase [Muribaculaceae bacterium]|nr:D-Ala-D-Ala carboxypeptidase family metallohydrolase [Muribaculaceae bacterium]